MAENNRNVLSYRFEGQRSKIRVAMGHVPSEGAREGELFCASPASAVDAAFPSSTFLSPLPAIFTPSSLHAGLCMSTKFPFHRDIGHIELGATLMTSF